MIALRTKSIRKFLLVVVLLSLVSVFAAVPATQAGGYCAQWHTVQQGQNLFRISRLYGTTVAYLQWLNQIPDANRIYAGQQLCISQGAGSTAYVIQRGDTLFKIARRFGVNMWSLAQFNNIPNVNRIYAGQTIYIPDVTIQY
ncbi:MAG: LysM peptidoglycan-binding domain-containing protein [Anaerolineae bacterium]|nr:LysM peptidoglycan-binding domain-containing protein [Anaerolineae bacterium]